MPASDLNAAGAAFFGKLPAAGDFVARGLPPGLRAPLDRWLTATLAVPPTPPPEGGPWCALLPWRGGVATLLAVPSADRHGRAFPLAAVRVGAEAPGTAAACRWCAAAEPPLRAAASGEIGPDELARRLADLPPPDGAAGRPDGPELLSPR